MTRLLLSGITVFALVISGCTTWSEEVRTINFPAATPNLRQVPIGLIDVFVAHLWAIPIRAPSPSVRHPHPCAIHDSRTPVRQPLLF